MAGGDLEKTGGALCISRTTHLILFQRNGQNIANIKSKELMSFYHEIYLIY
jgi:hypothetical protein